MMLAASEWVSVAIGWPVVGWWMTDFVVTLAVVVVACEVTGEVRRRRRIARREAEQREGVRHGRQRWGSCGEGAWRPVRSSRTLEGR